MERYNKSTMPVNAEKYFYDPPWDSNSRLRQHCLGLHYIYISHIYNSTFDVLSVPRLQEEDGLARQLWQLSYIIYRGYLLFRGERQIYFIECDENISKFTST